MNLTLKSFHVSYAYKSIYDKIYKLPSHMQKLIFRYIDIYSLLYEIDNNIFDIIKNLRKELVFYETIANDLFKKLILMIVNF